MPAEIPQQLQTQDWRTAFLPTLPDTTAGLQGLLDQRAPEIEGARIPVRRVLVARPLGFCAGVERAITALQIMVDQNPDQSVFCRNMIVHNDGVQKYFEGRGVTFFTDFDDVPDGAPIMLSAHGSSPDTKRHAGEKSSFVVDAVCPLVEKVHSEVARNSRKGREIVYIGHAGHDETVETEGVAPERFHLVASPADVDKIADQIGPDADIAVLKQTTLALGEWEAIDRRAEERFSNIWRPSKNDICFATTNRQAALINMINAGAETVLVVTSDTSSNGKALHRVALQKNMQSFIIDDPKDIPEAIRDTVVGITAAASTPGEQIFEVLTRLVAAGGVTFVEGVAETETFPILPPGLGRRN